MISILAVASLVLVCVTSVDRAATMALDKKKRPAPRLLAGEREQASKGLSHDRT